MIPDIILVTLAAANLAFLLFIVGKLRQRNDGNLDKVLRDELRQEREESDRRARELREELAAAQVRANDSLVKTVNTLGVNQKELLDNLARATKAGAKAVQELTDKVKEDLSKQREQIQAQLLTIQKENEERFERVRVTLNERLKEISEEQSRNLNNVIKVQQEEQAKSRETLERKFLQIQESNEKKLDEMRKTVDEKLHETLEKRLGESFKLVSERLEAVQRGLGEMQNLATGVGDLKRVLVNVKERGTWGEYQLGSILADILTPKQYAKNVATKEGQETVEFAVKLPGHSDNQEQPVWLPIDAKFPRESYERLVDASIKADAKGVKTASKELCRAIEKMAKDVQEKYINPPISTDFAILFLPTEGLYAEVLRQPGLQDKLQQTYRILVAGPTTLSAILSSLRVGFQTLAIEKRASEVWQVLGAVKTEFGKFGGMLDRVKSQINTVSNTLDTASTRTRAMERKLREVEEIPAEKAGNILGVEADFPDLSNDNEEEDTAT
ncbi:MAG: DNA recombination protein RmuC [Candidatus Hydrogenedentes bacterium]|nr:DNA recombination protein RmuC [Candidatus Hydrogenedentota bacterium]